MPSVFLYRSKHLNKRQQNNNNNRNTKKKIPIFSFLAWLILFALPATAQNIQLHGDFGRTLYGDEFSSRPNLTSTVEMFRPDKWGSTFFFIDMDYSGSGVVGSYWEIVRELRFWKAPLSIHVEYNGGNTNQFSINNAYLGGMTYTYNNTAFSKGFSISAMYKHIQKHDHPNNFQITGTWYVHFGKNGLGTFIGFADFWKEEQPGIGDFVFLAEPQLWFNLNKLKNIGDQFNLSIGTEVELRNNFAFVKGFYAIPTLAVKWTFN